jgi:hypothetical protein
MEAAADMVAAADMTTVVAAVTAVAEATIGVAAVSTGGDGFRECFAV